MAIQPPGLSWGGHLAVHGRAGTFHAGLVLAAFGWLAHREGKIGRGKFKIGRA